MKLTALFFACLMFIESVTLQATPIIVEDNFTIMKEIELKGKILSPNEEKFITIIDAKDPEKIMKVPSNTLIALKTTKEISAKEVKKGANISLRVAYDVRVKGETVIPAGTLAKGRVSYAQKPKMWGKPGKIEITVEELRMDNTTIPFTSDPLNEEGESRSGAAWTWFVVSLIILWPCIFVPFFLKGRNAVIPVGASIDAFTIKTLDLPIVE